MCRELSADPQDTACAPVTITAGATLVAGFAAKSGEVDGGGFAELSLDPGEVTCRGRSGWVRFVQVRALRQSEMVALSLAETDAVATS
jgi:hypothetical protein